MAYSMNKSSSSEPAHWHATVACGIAKLGSAYAVYVHTYVNIHTYSYKQMYDMQEFMLCTQMHAFEYEYEKVFRYSGGQVGRVVILNIVCLKG